MKIKVSIIIPTLNEENHINELVNSIYELDSISKEVFILDGGSTDGTREKVTELAKVFPGLILIDNPERYVSNGFNKVFKVTKGEYIALIG